MIPPPIVDDPSDIVLFGAYSLRHAAKSAGYRPGVFVIPPFIDQIAWRPFLLNGADARFMTLRDAPDLLAGDERLYFIRPVDDGKELAGRIWRASEFVDVARQALTLDEAEIPEGSLRHDTRLMLCEPAAIVREWRVWVVDDQIVTYSLYKDGSQVVHRHEIDGDALAFARQMVRLNPGYCRAYVIDVCRTDRELKLLETNCLNAAGLYAADLSVLAASIDAINFRE